MDWNVLWLSLAWIAIVLYSLALVILLVYSITQAILAWNYNQSKKKPSKTPKWDFNQGDPYPLISVQLPIFNELYVIKRLLASVTALDYPQSKLEIQVLDDSTDESVALTAQLVKEYQKQGFDIEHIRRTERTGFKAGALKEGVACAKGAYIAIFDADFLPPKDWLLRTVPYFKEKNIGVVQSRWGHINKNYSLLTKIQAFALDAHFTLEQTGRNSQGHFINFNGTAGIWRKECILDAGNWQGDTLTEDLDLSFRAQLKEWKFKYVEQLETPAELPITMSAIRTQQFRWNKGGAENFQKMIRRVWSNPKISVATKFHASMHLLSSSMFLSVLTVAVLSVPMLYIKAQWNIFSWYFHFSSLFIISTLFFLMSYWQMYRQHYQGGWLGFASFLQQFILFYTVAMGLSIHNSLAVLEGHWGKKSAFVRTPKFNLTSLNDSWKNNKYLAQNLSINILWESILALYFLFGIYSAFTVGKEGDLGLLPFHCMFFIGFSYIVVQSIRGRH
jgi:cellulose synthase/poly-beta-1,6-N-acetylglucosamine synthase-like glycosyltransferase